MPVPVVARSGTGGAAAPAGAGEVEGAGWRPRRPDRDFARCGSFGPERAQAVIGAG